jgi:hypothetical protein|uniref:Uncharacterized protein n=1 Tax=Myoviridae sp. ctBCv9 TaxID=2825045 RepID=A0A8S5U6D9_9CAUD|nr:MAG TPA: hypothetical protein [Myoviridae sp. ctBCv9]
MGEYIKLEDAIAIIEEKQKELCPVGRYGRGYVYGSDREKYDAWDEIIDALENVPAADVVQVLRCKDCKDWGPGTGDVPICWETYEPMPPDGFCSIGERKPSADG